MIKYISPTITEVDIPYTSTGPATLNILAPSPSTWPSALYSIAGDTIEFEKPVIGTAEPAPQYFPIIEYTLIDVKNAPKNINIIEVQVDAVSLSTL